MEEKKLPVMLSIRGEQYFDDVDPDATELMTEGTMTFRGEDIYLSYEESGDADAHRQRELPDGL